MCFANVSIGQRSKLQLQRNLEKDFCQSRSQNKKPTQTRPSPPCHTHKQTLSPFIYRPLTLHSHAHGPVVVAKGHMAQCRTRRRTRSRCAAAAQHRKTQKKKPNKVSPTRRAPLLGLPLARVGWLWGRKDGQTVCYDAIGKHIHAIINCAAEEKNTRESG